MVRRSFGWRREGSSGGTRPRAVIRRGQTTLAGPPTKADNAYPTVALYTQPTPASSPSCCCCYYCDVDSEELEHPPRVACHLTCHQAHPPRIIASSQGQAMLSQRSGAAPFEKPSTTLAERMERYQLHARPIGRRVATVPALRRCSPSPAAASIRQLRCVSLHVSVAAVSRLRSRLPALHLSSHARRKSRPDGSQAG